MDPFKGTFIDPFQGTLYTPLNPQTPRPTAAVAPELLRGQAETPVHVALGWV